MGYQDPVTRQIGEITQRVKRIKSFVEELEATCPDAGPRRFAQDTMKMCDIIQSSIEKDWDSLEDPSDEQWLFETCSGYQKAVRDLHTLAFSHLESPHPVFYPWDLIYPIESEIRSWCPSFSLSIIPYAESTYLIDARCDLIDSVYTMMAKPPPPPPEARANEPKTSEQSKVPTHWHVFLYFPKAETNSVLLATIMVSHEALHLKDHLKSISKTLYDIAEVSIDSPKVDQVVSEILKRPIAPSTELKQPTTAGVIGDVFNEPKIRSDVYAQTNDVIHQWLHEIIADLLAVRLFGPAYFLAFATHSLSLGVMDQWSDRYPSSRMRMALMLRELEAMAYWPSVSGLGRVQDELQFWSQRVTDQASPRDTILKMACDSIMQAAETIRTQVREATGSSAYCAEQFIAEALPLSERIKQGFPPTEVGFPSKDKPAKRATIQGILNAGWLAYLQDLDALAVLMQVKLEDEEPRVVEKLNALLNKSLEILTYSNLEQ